MRLGNDYEITTYLKHIKQNSTAAEINNKTVEKQKLQRGWKKQQTKQQTVAGIVLLQYTLLSTGWSKSNNCSSSSSSTKCNNNTSNDSSLWEYNKNTKT